MVDWEEVMARDGPAVWRCVYRLVGHRDKAKDCCRETFVVAVELCRRQDVRSWPALLLRLATARAVDRPRRRYGRVPAERVDGRELAGAVEDRHTPAPSQHAEAAELAAALRGALAELPGRQAQAFCLHHLEGWSYE